MLKCWCLLYLAICSEVVGTVAMKCSDGFTRVMPSCAVFVAYGISFILMSKALRQIDMGIAYAIWSAIGLVSISAISVVFFDELITPTKVLAYSLIIVGVLLLNVTATTS